MVELVRRLNPSVITGVDDEGVFEFTTFFEHGYEFCDGVIEPFAAGPVGGEIWVFGFEKIFF